MSEEEAILWSQLQELRKQGLHFRRQVPRDGYVLDFACLRAKAVVEVDGEQHFHGDRPRRDRLRDKHFEDQGFITLRYTTTEVRKSLRNVVDDIFLRVLARLQNPDHKE